MQSHHQNTRSQRWCKVTDRHEIHVSHTIYNQHRHNRSRQHCPQIPYSPRYFLPSAEYQKWKCTNQYGTHCRHPNDRQGMPCMKHHPATSSFCLVVLPSTLPRTARRITTQEQSAGRINLSGPRSNSHIIPHIAPVIAAKWDLCSCHCSTTITRNNAVMEKSIPVVSIVI